MWLRFSSRGQISDAEMTIRDKRRLGEIAFIPFLLKHTALG
jgi:hypothetical protein